MSTDPKSRADFARWQELAGKELRFSNGTIATSLRGMRAKHVMVVSDSCYSGALTRGLSMTRTIDDSVLAKLARSRTRTALTSGGNEPVADGGGSGHSVFARYFLAVLGQNESVLDASSLHVQMRKPVMANARQTPQYGDIPQAGHEDGDFLFVPVAVERR